MKKLMRKLALSVVLLCLLACTAVSAKAESDPYISWEERVIPNQYTHILLNGIEYESACASTNPYVVPPTIDESEIAEFLCQAAAVGYEDNDEKTAHAINSNIYSLASVSAAYAVAVEYEGYDGYFSFVNTSYIPETLGDMINDLGLRKNLTLNRIVAHVTGNYMTYRLPDSAAILELLLVNASSEGTKRENGIPNLVACMDAYVFFGVSGGGVQIFRVDSDGLLFVSLPLHNAFEYTVNEDSVVAFMEYVQTHGKKGYLDVLSGFDIGNPWIILGVAIAAIAAALIIVIAVMKKKTSN
ncbi:MAG: hypothetical protein FWE98_08865 [Oscillospiraceae bacterium]|nr:hypothetical protein [Oscillospiraceae bacterium]